jgi:DNA-binding beta-propeller fold protein YncE
MADRWPLASATVRLLWLQACCAVAEDADVPLAHTVKLDASPHCPPDAHDSQSRCPPDVCVAAVLGDALHRVSELGGREGMPRSLGSVYGGSVTCFLGGSCRGVVSRVIATHYVNSASVSVAVSVDGSTLLVPNYDGGSHSVHEFSVADGSQRRVVGGKGDGPLQFRGPSQVWIAADDFVFVADCGNNRVQVLTPRLDFHGFVGVGQLSNPVGVCANADVVVVAEASPAHRVAVFRRSDGALLRRFASHGSGDGQLKYPHGLCFTCGDRHVAIADTDNCRVSVLSVDGEFIRHVGVGVLEHPHGVACSAFDELVVADTGNDRVVVFGAGGELLKAMGDCTFRGVALHGGTIFAQDYDSEQCIVFS